MRTTELFVIVVVATPGAALAEGAPDSVAPPSSPAPTMEPPSPAAATAKEHGQWQFGVAPRVGVVIPTSKLGAMVLGGLELDYVLPVANRQLVVALDMSITRPSYDGSVMDARIPGGSAMYTIKETEMVIGATLGYRLLPANRALVPWGAIGPVLHLLRTSETTTFAPGTNTATSTELGVELAAGADLRAGPGFAVGGLRVIYSNLDHALTGDTNAGKVSLELGYRMVF